MPELPEVETVRSELEDLLLGRPVIEQVKLMREDIRFPIPKDLPRKLKGQPITSVRRRAKYLLFETPRGILLSHLGMTGSWRVFVAGEDAKHDHCYVILRDGRWLAFRDPRRFGLIDFIENGMQGSHPRLKDLGPEPLDRSEFHEEYLYLTSRKRRAAVKVFLMDQRVVVGVGNIYASEALFRSGVRPQKAAGQLTKDECRRLVASIRGLLEEAIRAGGSSIRDYRKAGGEEGGFQNFHKVYGRDRQPCVVCGALIRSEVLGGRSTYWCPKCQRVSQRKNQRNP